MIYFVHIVVNFYIQSHSQHWHACSRFKYRVDFIVRSIAQIGITLSGVCWLICLYVCLSGNHTFLVVPQSYVLQATHAFLWMLPLFLCPRIEWSGAYCFCPVCLSVCLSVCLFVCLLSTLTFAITFEPLEVETSYLACTLY